MIILCNFLTETKMTRTFANELTGLAKSLTPGGILLILGSHAADYDKIFDDLSALSPDPAGFDNCSIWSE